MVLKNQSGSRSAKKNMAEGSLTGKKRSNWHPAPTLTPGITKAVAMAEVKSSGTVKVFLRQWERPRSLGTGVERWQASTWICALGKSKEAQIQTKRNLAPTLRSFGHSWEQLRGEVVGPGTKVGSNYSRCLGGECPLWLKVDISVSAMNGLSLTYGNSEFLGYWGPEQKIGYGFDRNLLKAENFMKLRMW